MKRDINFTCLLLSYLELSVELLGVDEYELLGEFAMRQEISDASEDYEELKEMLSYHLAILESGCLIRRSSQSGDESIYYSLSWAGHEYLDSQRISASREILAALTNAT